MSKRIKGITIELDGETRGLDKALSDVNKRSRDLQKELRDVDRLLKFNPGNADLVAQKQKLLADQVENTRDKLNRLKEAEKQVQEQFAKGEISEEQYRAFQREIAETESKLKHFESQLTDTQSKLDKFGEKIGEAGEKFKDAGKKMTDTGKNLTAKVTAPIMGLGAIAAKVGSDFEASMSKVAAVSGATGGDLEALTKKAREVGAATQFSASEAADALNYMALAGWDVEQMLGGIDGVMALAAASGEDLAQVSDIVTDGLSAFGMKAEESGRFADVLAAASANANTDVSGLGAAFQYVAPVAGALGFTIEDTAKAIGIMSNSGIKGQKAGTALRTMMTNLAKPTAAMEKQMGKLGISLTDSEGNMKSFDTIMQELQVSFGGLSEAEQASAAATIFGKEAMSGALAIINTSASDYDKLSEAINGSQGAAQKMADVMTDNLQGRLKEMQSALEEAAISIYDNLKPVLEFLVSLVQKAADWFNGLSPAMQNTIVVIAGIVAAIGPLLILLGLMSSGIGVVMTVISSLIGILPVLGSALTVLTGPVGLVIAAVVALIAIGVALYKNWDKVKEVTIKVWNSIANFFKSLWNNIKNIFNSALSFLDSKTNGAFSQIVNVIKNYLNMALNIIKSILNFWINTFKNTFAFLKALVTGDFQGMKDAIQNQMKNILNTIKSIWNSVMNFFRGINLRSIGVNIIKGLISGISSMASSVLKSITGVVKGAIDGAKKLLGIKSPSRVFMEIGNNTGEGLVRGMDSTARQIQNASERMAEMSIPTVPQSAAVGFGIEGSGASTGGSLNLEGLFKGAVFNVREEQDIEKIAKALNDYIKLGARKGGVIIT